MDSPAASDRGEKLADPAASMIPEVWLVDLKKNLIEVHTGPEDGNLLPACGSSAPGR